MPNKQSTLKYRRTPPLPLAEAAARLDPMELADALDDAAGALALVLLSFELHGGATQDCFSARERQSAACAEAAARLRHEQAAAHKAALARQNQSDQTRIADFEAKLPYKDH